MPDYFVRVLYLRGKFSVWVMGPPARSRFTNVFEPLIIETCLKALIVAQSCY